MKCLYREKRYYCGNYLDVDIYPVFRKQRCRRGKAKPTTETQKLLNQRNAENKLRRLLNTNFTKKDIRFDLTYDKDHLPQSPEDAQKQLQNFLRRVKRYRKKNELPELKYVAVTEVGKRSGRYHHHIVMSGGIDIGVLADIWGRGYTSAKALQFDSNGLTGIAKYLIKDPILKKRWNASKNLSKPKESQRDGRVPMYKAKDLFFRGSDEAKYIEKLYPDYRLADCQGIYNEVNGGFYVEVRLYKDKPKT